MINNFKSGFTLIEILIVIAIIGIIISVGIPRLNRAGTTPLDNFLVKLNTLVKDAAKSALFEGVTYKILFNFRSRPKHVELRSLEDQLVTSIDIPDIIEFEDVYINRKSEPGKDAAWFYISQEGVSQEVIINFVDTEKKLSYPQLGDYSLVLNPFTAQFKLYDTFQKPKSA